MWNQTKHGTQSTTQTPRLRPGPVRAPPGTKLTAESRGHSTWGMWHGEQQVSTLTIQSTREGQSPEGAFRMPCCAWPMRWDLGASTPSVMTWLRCSFRPKRKAKLSLKFISSRLAAAGHQREGCVAGHGRPLAGQQAPRIDFQTA